MVATSSLRETLDLFISLSLPLFSLGIALLLLYCRPLLRSHADAATAGSGFWDTPMTRHLLKTSRAPAAADPAAGTGSGLLDRSASPAIAGASRSPADMYLVLMRLPLQGVFWWVAGWELGGVFCWWGLLCVYVYMIAFAQTMMKQ